MKIEELEKRLTELLNLPKNLTEKFITGETRPHKDFRICANQMAIEAILDEFMKKTGKQEKDEISVEEFSLLSKLTKEDFDGIDKTEGISELKRGIVKKELLQFLKVIEIIKKEVRKNRKAR